MGTSRAFRTIFNRGDVQQTKEDAIDDAVPQWMESLRRDTRMAVRALIRHRTFSITAILALSLAIAVNTSMFSVLDAMMNPEIGAREPDRLFQMKYFGDPRLRVDWEEREKATTAAIGQYGGYTEWTYGDLRSVERGVSYNGESPMKVRPNFFTTLGIEPVLGRVVPGGDNASVTASVVISTKLQALFFRDDESPIGKTVLLDGNPFTVIGVVRGFGGLEDLGRDIWYFSRANEKLSYKLVRLRDGMTKEQTLRKLDLLAAQLALAAGDNRKDTRFDLKPIKRQFSAGGFHYALVSAGLAILVVACTNLANLQLARGLTRSSELAVRSSLGATRRQIVSQLIIESAVLAIVALLVALLFAIAGNALLRAYVPPNVGGEFVIEPHSSWRMVGIAAFAAIVCLMSIGLLPALRVSRVDLNTLLKGRAGTGAHRSNRRIYGLLVIVQIGMTLPLICAAVLCSLGAWRSADMDYVVHNETGYDPRPIIRAFVPLVGDSSARKISYLGKASELIARAKSVPGVQYAAVYDEGRRFEDAVTVDDDGGDVRQVLTPNEGYTIVTEDYMRVFGYKITKGRDFGRSEAGGAPVIVDDYTTEALWPRSEVIGRTIKLGSMRSSVPSHPVIGTTMLDLTEGARDMRRQMRRTRTGMIYRLMDSRDSITLRRYRRVIDVTVRATGDPSAVAEALRRAFHQGSALAPYVMLEVDYRGLVRRQAVTRFVAGLFTVFGVIALGLSALGVYAIVAQSVTDRRREVAVRIALGARPKTIVYSLLREGNVLILAGIAIGLTLTTQFALRWIGAFTNAEGRTISLLFAATCAALFAAMVLSALGPAVMATQLDPMEVLRAE